jgi:hypothetical protein
MATLVAATAAAVAPADPPASAPESVTELDHRQLDAALDEIEQGRRIFRVDTFGNQAFWGGALRLHEAISGSANGGVGRGLSPNAALKLGLKVDANALPPAVVAAL